MAIQTINSLRFGDNIHPLTLPYGVCSTAQGTSAKTVTVSNFSLEAGAMVVVKFTNKNTASTPTLNVNGTGAKAIKIYGTTKASSSTTTNGWTAGAVQIFVYDGENWIRDYWSNTTYSNAGLGSGYAINADAPLEGVLTATLSSYSATTGGIVAVKFANDVPADAALNINDKGAKPIYYRGTEIVANTIKAGDIATFVYDGTNYHLLSIDNILHASLKGAAGGLAELDSNGRVPSSQLPSYVDDVEEYAKKENFPATGETDKIYVDLYTNKIYRWGGTAYVEISASLALGTTSTTAYYGDKGKIAYDHSQLPHAPSNAEKNQNAFSSIVVGDKTVAAEISTDSFKISAGTNTNVTADVEDKEIIISVPEASASVKGVTIVYPADSCTTFSSDSGTVTPKAVQKGAKMFAITRPASSTANAITRYSNTTGDVKDSKIKIEDVANTKNSSLTGQVISVPTPGNKKMVYGYCTDQDDGTAFIGGLFAENATTFPHDAGLAIGGTSTNLLWKGNKVLDTTDKYAGSSTPGGSATSAVKLDTTTAGSATQPVYFTGGKPVATTYTLGKSVPSDAKFTDTTYLAATTSAAGLMSATDKSKLDGIDLKDIPYYGDSSDGGSLGDEISLSDLMPKAGGTFTGAVEYTTLTGGNITSSGTITGNKVYGAVWNDYAEFRQATEDIEPGRVVCENGDDTVSLSTKRMQPGAMMVSDTYGFAIGETDKCKCPIAVAGRVLMHPYEKREKYKPGDAVCSGPNGTVSKMSRLETILFPDRILGTVSSIPDYEFWGEENIEVKNRIWINKR